MKLRGFTLVEVVIVVAIIAILTTVIIPDLWISQQRTAGEMFINNVYNIITTLEVYKKEHGNQYPSHLEDLAIYFDKQPINPYTEESMLTSDNSLSGVNYIPAADLRSYTLIIVQKMLPILIETKTKPRLLIKLLG